jgi:hypothetical protein
VLSLYRRRLSDLQPGDATSESHIAQQAERSYGLTALHAERDTILRLARSREVSDDTARKLLREIDLAEARYR